MYHTRTIGTVKVKYYSLTLTSSKSQSKKQEKSNESAFGIILLLGLCGPLPCLGIALKNLGASVGGRNACKQDLLAHG
jgi:hypothetical protein